MCKTFAMIILAGAVAFAVVPYVGHAAAHEDQGQGGTIHGGVEAKTKRHHFEAVFARGGVKLYVHGTDHRPVDVSRLAANATFYHPNSTKPWFTRELRPAATQRRTGVGIAGIGDEPGQRPCNRREGRLPGHGSH